MIRGHRSSPPDRPPVRSSRARTSAIWGGGASTRVGRYTHRAHVRAAFFDGLALGVLTLNEFVAKKTLGASDWIITALVMAQPISLLFSSYWSNFLVGREKRTTFLLFGILGRLSLVLVVAAQGGLSFAVLVIFATLMVGAIIPAQNALFQTNYDVIERGRAYGVATAVQSLATIAAALLAGRLYDFVPEGYRWAYVAAGICGFISCWIYYRIRFRRRNGGVKGSSALHRGLVREMGRSLRSPFSGSFTILKQDPGFRRYEIAFMSYGLAFMMLQPVIPVFLVEVLHVDYSQASNARGLIFYSMMVLFSPVFGRLLDRSDPVKISTFAFLLLSLFPAALILSRGVHSVYMAFGIYGIAMSAVNIGWTLGPIYFARKNDSAAYMGAHVALVGLRGLVGGPIGILLYRLSGTPNTTFVCAAILFILASFLMASLDRSTDRHDEVSSGGRGTEAPLPIESIRRRP